MRTLTKATKRVAVALGVLAVAIVGHAALAGATGRLFEPDYPMSKQYVAVATYKILRDYAPAAVADCESNVKSEPTRFADIGGAGAFTQGAINCLDKLGYLDGLPGGDPSGSTPATPTTTPRVTNGAWETFSGDNTSGSYVGVVLQGEAPGLYSWEQPPLLYVRCGTGGASANDDVFVGTPWLIFNDYDSDSSTVEWRISPHMPTPVQETDWWSNEDSNSVVFAPDRSSLKARLASTDSGRLHMTIIPGSTIGNAESASFDITGAAAALANLPC